MAEAVGFELTNGLTRCRFSRPVPSTTRPHLQKRDALYIIHNQTQPLITDLMKNYTNPYGILNTVPTGTRN